jgi:aldehyde dehydrogenase (NAD+)
MGGKNPAIVCASADVDDASRKLAWGRVANGGQVCIAPDYALVHESIRAAFIDGLKKWMTAMFDASGTGFDRSPELPRIVNARHARRVKDLIDDAVTKGATIEFGGRVAVEERFVEPTILSNVDDGMRIMQEEVFGPVLAVLPFDRREQVASEIRKRPKPLSLYLYSKDREEIDWLLGHTSAGSSVVNHNMIQSGSNPHLPFGGVNASGIGRLGGHWTFLECSNARSVVEDAPGLGDPGMMFPPYSDTLKRLIDSFLSRSIDMPDTIVSLLDGAVALTSRILRRDRM